MSCPTTPTSPMSLTPCFAASFSFCNPNISSSRALLKTMQQLGYNSQAKDVFCSQDVKHLALLHQTDAIDLLDLKFKDNYFLSCAMAHLAKVYAHLGLFKDSQSILLQIPLAHETVDGCKFLGAKMVEQNALGAYFQLISKLFNISTTQKKGLELIALNELYEMIQNQPANQESLIQKVLIDFKSTPLNPCYDEFWEKIYQHFHQRNLSSLAMQSLAMISSIKTKERLLAQD